MAAAVSNTASCRSPYAKVLVSRRELAVREIFRQRGEKGK
jgi:hypothetical protein